jgi:multisubunit Na+/H+ antiporter MnhB subunit
MQEGRSQILSKIALVIALLGSATAWISYWVTGNDLIAFYVAIPAVAAWLLVLALAQLKEHLRYHAYLDRHPAEHEANRRARFALLIGVLFSILGMAWPFIVPYFIDVSTELGGWLQLGGGIAFLAVGSVPLAHYAFVTWRIGSRMDEEQS